MPRTSYIRLKIRLSVVSSTICTSCRQFYGHCLMFYLSERITANVFQEPISTMGPGWFVPTVVICCQTRGGTTCPKPFRCSLKWWDSRWWNTGTDNVLSITYWIQSQEKSKGDRFVLGNGIRGLPMINEESYVQHGIRPYKIRQYFLRLSHLFGGGGGDGTLSLYTEKVPFWEFGIYTHYITFQIYKSNKSQGSVI